MATILIVDDISADRRLLVALLASHGHRPLEAADGRAGLVAAMAERPDLVITDVLMPVMDGYDFVTRLRLEPAMNAVPVVFCTAHYGERDARALALTSGVSRVLTKPIESAAMLQLVGSMLAGEPDAVTVAEAHPVAHEFDREHVVLLTDKMAEEVSELKSANARLRALVSIGSELAFERDAERRLRSLCESARDLCSATYVTLGIIDPQDQALQYVITCGTDAPQWLTAGDTVEGILKTAVFTRQTLRGDNPGGDPTRLRLSPNHPAINAFLVAPIASPTHVYGWVCLAGNEGRTFTEVDEHVITALAAQVGCLHELEREIADRTHAEAALRDERDRAQRYLDTAEVILLGLDMEGRVTLVNRYACSVLGWTSDELLGQVWVDACCPVQGREELRHKRQKPAHGGTALIESSVLTRAGEERLIEWHNTVLRDGAGHVIGTFSSGSDITERKRAVEEMRRLAHLSALGSAVGLSVSNADSLSHALQQCAAVLDTHLDEIALVRLWTLNANDGMLDLQASAGIAAPGDGTPRRIPIGQFTVGRIASDRQPQTVSPLAEDPEGDDREWAKHEGLVAFAGHPLIVEGLLVGVAGIYGRRALSDAVVGELASVADYIAVGIARQRSVEALQTAEERTRFALETAAVGIWDMDFTSGVLRWSKTVEAQYGLAPGTFAGTFEAFIARIHPDDQEGVRETLEKATRSGADFSTLHRAIGRDGSVRWLSGTGRVLLGDDGAPARGVGICMDVTEHHMMQGQFQQAQKMEAIGRLAGGVAHDFNNLLTVILGYGELLLANLDPGDPRHADMVEIQKAGTTAAGLTRQLLAFSRKQVIEPTLLDLNVVVTDIQTMLGRLIREDVTVVLALQPGPVMLKADRGQLEQIVMNLAVNARDAMPRGGTLTIETAHVELDEHYAATHLSVSPGEYVALTVTDTGTGMTPEVQARLFEPFFTTKEIGKGTGFGLATVHAIVSRSGGSVGVYSELGRGTAFRVYFPRIDVPAPLLSDAVQVALPAQAPGR